MAVYLDVLNVSFSYHAHSALDGVNFSVKQGDFLGIIGPNGSGKSSLLKVMSGLLKPQHGTVLLQGTKLDAFSRKRIAQLLAVVPQDTSSGFNFKVKDVVMMGRYPHQKKFARETEADNTVIEKAMELTGCAKLKERSYLELSGGEKQLVILARALAQEPSILLLDEPTSHLDIGFQTEIFDLIYQLNREAGITVVAVLHDLNLASQYCDCLWLMKEGKMFAAGLPEKVITEDNIKEVYHTKVFIEKHPIHRQPRVTLLSNKLLSSFLRGKKIHLVGGGGSASSLMSFLKQNGADVSIGVINIGDTDWETARQLNITVVEENPFSPLTQGSLQKCRLLMEEADYIIVAEVPFGYGNLGNIVLARGMLANEKPVFLLHEKDWSERDYTDGKAEQVLAQMKQEGAVVFKDTKDLIKYLQTQE